jgi:hypothetical protein
MSITSTWAWLANLSGWWNTQIKNSRCRRAWQLYCHHTLSSLTARAFRKTNLDITFCQCPCHFIIRHSNANHVETELWSIWPTITPLLPAAHQPITSPTLIKI